ncbi:MAG: hypothetical protein DMF76_18030 [Acidobacteria bacterium]|nr:MAG: hypothetical protein DMF76_18030 [Acidobacteriota bacterium]
MLTRVLAVFTILTSLISCTAPVPINRRSEAPCRDPGISGRPELISRPELLSALAAARARLATLAPSSPIFRVIVITPAKLEAY